MGHKTSRSILSSAADFGVIFQTRMLLFIALLPTAGAANEAVRNQLVLADGWYVRQLEGSRHDLEALTESARNPDARWMPAVMPKQVQEILFERGLIPDPRVSTNATQCTWVFEQDWAYACPFESPRGNGPVLLRFEGLDTLANVYVNGVMVGRAENMFRRYSWDIRTHLRTDGQKNILLIIFESPVRFLDGIRKKYGEENPIPAFKYLRKCGSDFSSYLGARPHFIKMGIFREVILDMPGSGWLEDICVRTTLNADRSRARIEVFPEPAGERSPNAELRWTLRDGDGKEVVAGKGARPVFDLDRPRLWWPHTHGTPHLYSLQVDYCAGELLLDRQEIRFGIRQIEPVLKDPKTGAARFGFKVNGQHIFLKGACWAPLEGLAHCWNEARANQLLDLAVNARMNVIRVWGEGHIPARHFYEECDRRGILVWQDFMTGWGLRFPLDHPGFAENLRQEFIDMIVRLRNHPCILLWVGGNEHYLGYPSTDKSRTSPMGREIFEVILPDLCKQFDPGRYFHPSSPWGGLPTGNYPLEGDWHDYTTLRFMHNASVPLYASEVCQVSAPSLSSMKRFLTPEELWPAGFTFRIDTPGEIAWPEAWEYHTTSRGWEKTGRLEEFCDPRDAEDLIRALGIAHGESLQRKIERHRRGVPDGSPDGNRRCWGDMIWRLNDPWPMIYMAAVDYYLEPKIAYYYLRRIYEPVLVSFERTPDNLHVWVVNDSPETAAGNLIVRRMNFSGKVLGTVENTVTVQPGQSKRCIDTTPVGDIDLRREFLLATFGAHRATLLLSGERHLALPEARLKVERKADGVQITTNVFARQVTLEILDATGAVFEDNYFDMVPGETRFIRILNRAGGKSLRVKSLNAGAYDLAL